MTSARAKASLASRVVASTGQNDMVWGHVAVRDPEGRGIWIKAPGWGLEEASEERIQLVSFDAKVLLGAGEPHKECHIHLEILRLHGHLECVVHTHPPAAVAFASLGSPLLPISHDAALFAGEDVPRFVSDGALVSSAARGQALAKTLGTAPGALLPAHGLVAAGPSVATAVMHAVLLERACRVQLDAMRGGGIATSPDAEQAQTKRSECWAEEQLVAGWDYLVRRTPTHPPGLPSSVSKAAVPPQRPYPNCE